MLKNAPVFAYSGLNRAQLPTEERPFTRIFTKKSQKTTNFVSV